MTNTTTSVTASYRVPAPTTIISFHNVAAFNKHSQKKLRSIEKLTISTSIFVASPFRFLILFRWIRCEQCRHALLVVRGALYLLELPTDAVVRHSTTGRPTRARGSWYMRLNASDLDHLSVPLTLEEPAPRTLTAGKENEKSHANAKRVDNGTGLVLHKRGRVGAYAWLECRNSASRDALVDLVSAWAKADLVGTWAKAGMKHLPLRVDFQSVAQLSAGFWGQRQGRKFPTLIDERQACPLW